MQIIFKEKPCGQWCLFDTRSDQFFEGGNVSNHKISNLNYIANSLVRKTPKTIYNIMINKEYGDDGYVESMLAKEYLRLNPDIKSKAKDLIAETPPKKSKLPKFVDPDKPKGKRGRPAKSEATDIVEKSKNSGLKSIVTNSNNNSGVKRSRGRPRKNPDCVKVYIPTGKQRGRPKKQSTQLSMTV